MKKFFTNLRKNSTENKGFSLVELIIVIAIMVALVAMLAPQFVKYVQKSRDAVITRAAEDVLAVAKSEYALGHLKVSADAVGGEGYIRVQTNENGKLTIPDDNAPAPGFVGLDYNDEEGNTGREGFLAMCGFDANQVSKSQKAYIITIKSGGFQSEESGAVFSEQVTDGGYSGD